MEGLNKELPQKNKMELAQVEVFEQFKNIKQSALERIMNNPHYKNLSERVEF